MDNSLKINDSDRMAISNEFLFLFCILWLYSVSNNNIRRVPIPSTNIIMGHDDCLHDLYDSYPTNFISQNRLESSLDDLAGYDPFSKSRRNPTQSHVITRMIPSIHRRVFIQRLTSKTDKDWSKHSHIPTSITTAQHLRFFPLPAVDMPRSQNWNQL